MYPAIVLHGPSDLRLQHRQLQPPAAGEVQVSIQATGLCGSDLHYYTHGRNGDFTVQSPLVLGHEAAGIITAIGPDVSISLNLHVGDRVAIEPGSSCGHADMVHRHEPTTPSSPASSHSSDIDEEGTAVSSSSEEDDDEAIQGDGCEFCEIGRYNLCEGMRFCSSAKTYPHLDGTLQSYMNHPANLLHKLPDSCSFEQAALAEPLSVVLHAARRIGFAFPTFSTFSSTTIPAPLTLKAFAARTRPKRALIIGAGAIGFLAAALIRTLSALGESTASVSYIAAMDLDKGKLEALQDAGYADAVFEVPRTTPEPMTKEDGLSRSKELAKDALVALSEDDRGAIKGYDIVFECTGVESCIQSAILMARTGGKVALVGMGTPNPYLPLSSAAMREVDLVGVFRYANTWPDALRLLASKTMIGIEDVMVTQRFHLEETAEAFKVLSGSARKPGETVLKIMVGPHYGNNTTNTTMLSS